MSISHEQPEPNTPANDAKAQNRAAQNGRRHSLTGQAIIMTNEDFKHYEIFTKAYIETLKPANPVELQLAHLIAHDNHRINRIHAIEENTFSIGQYTGAAHIEARHPEIQHAFTTSEVFRLEGKVFQNLSLYEQRLTRNIHKNIKLLHELQDRRKAEEQERAEAQARESEALKAELKPRTRTAASASYPENAFGFSPAPATIDMAPDTTPNIPPDTPNHV